MTLGYKCLLSGSRYASPGRSYRVAGVSIMVITEPGLTAALQPGV